MRFPKFLAPTVLALALSGAAAATPALADWRGGETYRVVGLGGYQTLHLMSSPDFSSELVVLVPSSACHLRATGSREGGWVEITYRTGRGFEYTGWADSQYLAPERVAYHDRDGDAPGYGAYVPPPKRYGYDNPDPSYSQAPAVVPSQPVSGYVWHDNHRPGYYGW